VGDEGFGRVDWFSGRVEVPFDSDVDGVRLVELGRVYSFPGNAWPNFQTGGSGEDLGFALELRDSTGVVLSQPFLIGNDRLDVARGRSSSVEVFDVRVVDPPVYDSFAVKVGGRELAVVERSPGVPSVSVSGVCEGRVFGQDEQVRVAWEGRDMDGDRLTYKVFRSYNAGGSWGERTISDFGGSRWDFLKFAADEEVMVAVSVSDGTRSTFAVTPTFRVAEHDPQVKILHPVSGASFYGKQEFRLLATSSDIDEGINFVGHLDDDAHVWSSNLDGHLGIGADIELSADKLTPGDHTITVVVTDKTGRQASDSINLEIRAERQDKEPVLVDWFVGAISVHHDSDDISAFGLEELAVYSLPITAGLEAPVSPKYWEFELELRDNSGASIRKIPFNIDYLLARADIKFVSGVYTPTRENFSVAMPDPPDYASFAINLGDIELATLERSPNAPTVSVQGISENQFFTQDDELEISWVGQDQDGDPLTFRVFTSHDAGQTWQRESNHDTDITGWDSFVFQATDQAKIAVATSDGTRSTFTITPTFQTTNWSYIKYRANN